MHDISADLVIRIYVFPQSSAELSFEQWQNLVLILRHQQLLACYSARFKQAGNFDSIPTRVKRHFLNADVIAANHKQQVQFEAAELQRDLSEKGRDLIFLKGAGYTLSNAKVCEGRIYNDIDLLTDKQSVSDLEKKLCMLGWLSQKLTSHDEKYYRKWAHEIPPLRHGKRGTIVDIHHNIVPIISGRHIDVDLFVKHSVKTAEGFQVLSFPAMTLHSLIHLFFNEEVKKGYRDLIDIHTLMTSNNNKEFWLTLIRLSKETGFGLELFLACRYTQRFLSTQIPEYVVSEISQFQPWNIGLLDFIYNKTLKPNHPICQSTFFGLAEFLVLIRGHFQKMPPHILAYHLFTKGCLSLIQMMFGKHVFTKQLDQP
jgi:hypothetical protein